MSRTRMLVVGDAGCPSGFARATHAYIEAMDYRCSGGGDFDVTVLAINYRGDPHRYPYPIYAAGVEGDMFGVGRLIWMCDLVKPDVVIIQNDPWNFPLYMRQLRQFPEYASVPVVGIVAVDGKNCAGRALNGLSMAIFWTRFGLDEARKGGYTGPGVVIPLGVDLKTYYPTDKYEARMRRGLPKIMDDSFIVGNVNRNQPRKRWDLTIKYFAEWVHNGPLKDAYLYLHTAPTGDMGIQVSSLAAYYGIAQRLLLLEPRTFYGSTEDEMRDTYNCFDVQISTTQGEGFGLTTFEGMACGVPQIVPDWSALGELCKDAARLVPCTSTAIGPPYVNVIGGVADERMFVAEIDALYKNRTLRERIAGYGYARSHEDRFRWESIGEAVRLVTGHVVRCHEDEAAERTVKAEADRLEAERVAWGLGGGVAEQEAVA